MDQGFVRVHYFGGSTCAELLPAFAGALIAQGLAEEIDERGQPVKEAQYMEGVSAPNVQQTAAIVPHKETAAMPRPNFARQPRAAQRATVR
jgi:hypothetical protein